MCASLRSLHLFAWDCVHAAGCAETVTDESPPVAFLLPCTFFTGIEVRRSCCSWHVFLLRQAKTCWTYCLELEMWVSGLSLSISTSVCFAASEQDSKPLSSWPQVADRQLQDQDSVPCLFRCLLEEQVAKVTPLLRLISGCGLLGIARLARRYRCSRCDAQGLAMAKADAALNITANKTDGYRESLR